MEPFCCQLSWAFINWWGGGVSECDSSNVRNWKISNWSSTTASSPLSISILFLEWFNVSAWILRRRLGNEKFMRCIQLKPHLSTIPRACYPFFQTVAHFIFVEPWHLYSLIWFVDSSIILFSLLNPAFIFPVPYSMCVFNSIELVLPNMVPSLLLDPPPSFKLIHYQYISFKF